VEFLKFARIIITFWIMDGIAWDRVQRGLHRLNYRFLKKFSKKVEVRSWKTSNFWNAYFAHFDPLESLIYAKLDDLRLNLYCGLKILSIASICHKHVTVPSIMLKCCIFKKIFFRFFEKKKFFFSILWEIFHARV